VSDDGNYTVLDSVANNANAEIPREYHRGNDALGGYYNWYAATAESGKYTIVTSSIVDDSICPNGWRLPSNISSYKSWPGLTSAYEISSNADGTKKLRSYPLSNTMPGGYDLSSGALYGRGSYAYYWESVASYNAGAFLLYFNNASYVNPTANVSRSLGYSIRCVRK